MKCARYIERNPVEAGIVSTPWEYDWSSSRCCALGVPDALLDYNVWYQDLGRNAAGRQIIARLPGFVARHAVSLLAVHGSVCACRVE